MARFLKIGAILLLGIGYVLISIYTANLFYLNSRANSVLEYLLLIAIIALALLFWKRSTSLQPLLLACFIGFAFVDPNPRWNTQFWWQIYSPPYFLAFLCILIPGSLVQLREPLRSLFSESWFWRWPLLIFGAVLIWLLSSGKLGFLPAVLSGTSPITWINQYPHSIAFALLLTSLLSATAFYLAGVQRLVQSKIQSFAKFILIVSIIIGLTVLVIYIGGNNRMFTLGEFYRLWGFRVGPNHLGLKAVLFMLLSLAAEGAWTKYPKYRIFRWAGPISMTVLATLTLSRSTAIAFIGALVIWSLFRRTPVLKKSAVLLSVALITLSVLSSVYQTNYFKRYTLAMTPTQQATHDPVFSRPALYQWGWQSFMEHPIGGKGLGWQQQYLGTEIRDLYTAARLPHLRCFYLDLLVGGGLIYLGIFLGILAAFGAKFYRKRKESAGSLGLAAIIAILLHCSFDSVMLEPVTQAFSLCVLVTLTWFSETSDKEAAQ